MAQVKDSQGNVIEQLDVLGGITLIDLRAGTVSLGSLNAEVVFDCANINGAAIDVRGVFVGTFLGEFSIDGTNYAPFPIFNPLTEVFLPGITVVGAYVAHLPAATKKIRIRCSAYTSGTAIVALRGSAGDNFMYAKPIPSNLTLTITAATGSIATATLPSAGVGLFHYITRIIIQRHTSALLTPAATPILVTTTNLPGTRVFSVPADAAPQGQVHTEIVEPTTPIKSSAAATNTVISAPATTGVIWRITVDYYAGQ